MNWLNLQTSVIRSPEYVGCDPVQRATWLNLMIYCAEQENGGVIPDCASWKDRRWQQTCGVTKPEVDDQCDLWSFDGENLTIWAYPAEKQEEIQKMRESGARGGKKRAENAAKSKEKQDSSSPPSTLPSSPPSTERKGKEEERNRTLPPTPQGEASESAEDFYEDNMPTQNAQSMLDLEKRVRSLRSGWELPLAYTEQKLLSEASRTLSALNLAQWQTLKDYMHAKIPEGRPAWQPRTRTKFLETVGDVWNYASEWRRRQEASRPPPNTIPMPVSSRPTISREELAEVFGDPIKKQKM
jgi:hypothetical protein